MADNQPYIVSARKYRPSTFDSVVGQRALTATLKNAVKSGRLAQAYLFCGPRGVGKTSCARIFAKTINCLNPTPDGEACGECESCKAIEKGNSFNLIELDAASNNSVDNIRNITDQVYVPAQNGKYRVFIIDEVHMLSNQAFNAFLKTLEEPPKNVVFILATTERHKVIPTILSRCQVYDFRRITVNDIIDHLSIVAQKEGFKAEREALGVIALKADGAMRDALSIFDQVAASTHGNLTYSATVDVLNVLDKEYYFRLVDLFKKGDVSGSLLILKEIVEKGFDPQFFINGLASHIRDLMVASDPRTKGLLETSAEMVEKYLRQAPEFPADWYYNALQILNDCDLNYRISSNKRLLVELALIKLNKIDQAPFVERDVQKPQERPTGSGSESKSSPTSHSEANSQQTNLAASRTEEVRQNTNKPTVSSYQPVRRDKVRPSSFRLSEQKGNSYGLAGKDENRDSSFTESELEAAWNVYIEKNPDQRILVSAMRGNPPRNIDGKQFKVTVQHPAQLQAFETVMTDLVEYLRNSLKNDFIQLQVGLSEIPTTNNTMNPKEFLKLVVEENEELARFLKATGAELE